MMQDLRSKIFEKTVYGLLLALGWKRKTVKANLQHVQPYSGNSSRLAEAASNPDRFYRRLLKNLVHHVGELLFHFDRYKNLPQSCQAYPFTQGTSRYELAEGSSQVVEKMRRGGIFLTAHYGNYEASGAWLCALGVPVKASFIPLKPAWLNKYIYEKVRSVRGRPYSVDARTPREFLRILDSGELFCLLADQDSRIPSALEGTFLGQPAKVNPLPDFLLKHRPHTPVFFCWIQEPDESRKILHAVEAPKAALTTDGPYRNWLEERVYENPALWYGFTHRRFRSKNPEIYG